MKLKWAVGDELKSLDKSEITREQLLDYADASGDRNPIHLDEQFAKEAGFPSVIVHGMLPMAFMGDVVLFNFPENDFWVRKIRAKFRKVTFPGNRLTCGGSVKRINEDGSLNVLIWAKDETGELKTDGEVDILPK
jgi:acyl dehydratase